MYCDFNQPNRFRGEDPFQKGIGLRESKQNVIKDVSLLLNGGNSTNRIKSL